MITVELWHDVICKMDGTSQLKWLNSAWLSIGQNSQVENIGHWNCLTYVKNYGWLMLAKKDVCMFGKNSNPIKILALQKLNFELRTI